MDITSLPRADSPLFYHILRMCCSYNIFLFCFLHHIKLLIYTSEKIKKTVRTICSNPREIHEGFGRSCFRVFFFVSFRAPLLETSKLGDTLNTYWRHQVPRDTFMNDIGVSPFLKLNTLQKYTGQELVFRNLGNIQK